MVVIWFILCGRAFLVGVFGQVPYGGVDYEIIDGWLKCGWGVLIEPVEVVWGVFSLVLLVVMG